MPRVDKNDRREEEHSDRPAKSHRREGDEDNHRSSNEESAFRDENLECKDCGNEFVFSAGEQEFYQQKGFENKPVRCKACKDAKKSRMEGGRDGGRDGGRGGGGYGDRGSRDAPRGGGGGGPCYAHQRGECTRGDSCRFSHEGGGGGGGGGRSSGGYGGDRGGRDGGDRGGARTGGGGGPCYAHQRGECTRGDGCRFSHN